MSQFSSSYPHLTQCLNAMFQDNYGQLMEDCVKPEKDWPSIENGAELEKQAALLTDTEKETIACGEYSEVRALVESRSVELLNDFLGEVFDGSLTSAFLFDDQDG